MLCCLALTGFDSERVAAAVRGKMPAYARTHVRVCIRMHAGNRTPIRFMPSRTHTMSKRRAHMLLICTMSCMYTRMV